MIKKLLSLAALVVTFSYCVGANLLFKDSFEGSTRVYNFHTNQNQWFQAITGSSDTLGLVWPGLGTDDRDPEKALPPTGSLPFLSFGSCQAQLWYNNPVVPVILLAGTSRIYQSIDFALTEGRFGTQTRAVYMRSFQDAKTRIYDGVANPDLLTDELGNVRTNCIVSPDSSIANWQMYQSMWVKFGANTDELFANQNNFKFWDLWEYKSYPNPCDPDGPGGQDPDPFNFDTRFSVGFVWHDLQQHPTNPNLCQSGTGNWGIFWTANKETLSTPGAIPPCQDAGSTELAECVSNATVGYTFGTWMKIEIFVKSRADNTGRLWARLTPNGGTPFVLVDWNTFTYRAPYKISKWNLWKDYVHERVHELNEPFAAEIWVDELEFWDDIP